MLCTATRIPMFFRWLAICLVAAACGSDRNAPEQEGQCWIDDSRAIGLLDPTPSGHTVEEALSLIMKEHHARLAYERDGASTDVNIQVYPRDGSILFVRHAPEASYPYREACDDEVRIPARIMLQSGDGAFDEEIEAMVRVRATGMLFEEAIHQSELKGTYDPSWAPLSPGEEITYYVGGYFEPEGVSGGVMGIAVAPYQSGTDLTALYLWIGVLYPPGQEGVPPGQQN